MAVQAVETARIFFCSHARICVKIYVGRTEKVPNGRFQRLLQAMRDLITLPFGYADRRI